MTNPLDFAKDYIFTWEDGSSTDPKHTHSMDKSDPGNWSTGRVGVGNLIGSNHGVTASTLATYRKVPISQITIEAMHKLTLEEAAQIALQGYYYEIHLDKLPWDPVIASVMDFGWGAGKKTAVRILQRMLEISESNVDGNVGPGTVKAYEAFKQKHTLPEIALEWANTRIGYYKSLNQEKFGKYMKGWISRTMYFAPDSAWWNKFK